MFEVGKFIARLAVYVALGYLVFSQRPQGGCNAQASHVAPSQSAAVHEDRVTHASP